LLLQGSAEGLVRVFDIVSGKELAAFKGHKGAVNAVVFSPDDKTAASAAADGTLIWDVSQITRPALPAKALPVGDLDKCWQALAEQDAKKAWTAMIDLVAAPKDAVPFLKARLKPAAPLDRKRVQELIGQLDADFEVREAAAKELLQLGEQVVPALDKALAGKLPLETNRRLEDLRGKLTGLLLQGQRLRAYRAVEVLELIATPEARQVLQALAGGAPDALLTTSAQAALKR
jgi:hypothetical protein